MSSTAASAAPTSRTIGSRLGRLWHVQLAGEAAVAALRWQSVILRTSLGMQPGRHNFVKTMLRLAGERRRNRRGRRPDGGRRLCGAIWRCDRSSPRRSAAATARPCAAFITPPEPARRRGAGLAGRSWRGAGTRRAACRVQRHRDRDYPTPARRPANSRLDSVTRARLRLRLPPGSDSLDACLDQLLATPQRVST